MSNVRFIGLDVHAETIAVAVAEPDGEVRSLGVIPNRPESIRKLVKKLGPAKQLRVCYEAGPTGYVVYWQLTALGVACEVVAPTLVPVKAGDRVKTDRRDALKLARSYRAGDLTPVWVPDAAHEALRDLVRAREAAKKDQLRARHRLGKFLLRHGRRPPTAMKAWTQAAPGVGEERVHFEHAAQEATLLDYLHEVEHVAERIARLERAIDEAVQTAPAPHARGDRGAAGAARDRAGHGGDDRRGSRRALALCQTPPADGLQRRGRERGFQRRRASGAAAITKTGNAHLRRVVDRSGLGLSAPTGGGRRAAEAPGRRQCRGERDRVEGAASAARALPRTRRREANVKQQVVTAIGRELLGIHLGHRGPRGTHTATATVAA